MRFLVDECLSVELPSLLIEHGHYAEHVSRIGCSGWKDHSVMELVREQEAVFVTNNAVDFRRLHARETLHPGLIIILPNVPPQMQKRLLGAVMQEVSGRNSLLNTVIEVDLGGRGEALLHIYEMPKL